MHELNSVFLPCLRRPPRIVEKSGAAITQIQCNSWIFNNPNLFS